MLSFHKVSNCVFHPSNLLVHMNDLRKRGVVSKLSDELLLRVLIVQCKLLVRDVFTVHKFNKFVTESTTFLGVDVKL